MKMEMVARIFAETGVKELFLKIHELVIKHQKIQRVIKLTGEEWVTIDPLEWRNRMNMTVTVGLGNGNRDQTIMNLNMLGTHLSNIRQDPEMKAIIQPQNVYNLLREATKAMGMKNYQDFFTDPATLPPEAFQDQSQQQDPMAQVLQQKAQADAMKAQVDMQKAQIDMQELEEDVKQNQFDNNLDISKGKLEEHKLKLDIEKLMFEKKKLMAEIAMEQEENKLKIMELGAEIQEQRSIKVGE
jgi:hypothetical protein